MAISFFNRTIVREDRWNELKQRERGYHDLEFLKVMRAEDRSRCMDLLQRSNAQLRQDVLALAMTGFRKGGYFVEFGATDGVSLNNTLLLESEFGWSGILAEPAIQWHADLKKNRKCMIDTRCVWKESGETLQFTQAPRGENSGISQYVSAQRKMRGETYDVSTISFSDLLAEHGAPALIDYASVDTEGSEFEILNALDWKRWSFRLLTIEHNFAPQREDIHRLLSGHGYRRVFEAVSRFDDWYLGPET